jgi:hypothetical protein
MRVHRALAARGGAPRAWMALAAAVLLPMVVAVLVLRAAREGLRAFGGPGAWLRAYGVALWLASLLVALSALGSVLRASTHQHALAGVTFAFGGLALALGFGAASARVVQLLREASPGARRALALVVAAVVGAALAWVGLGFARAATRDAESAIAAGTVVDVLAFALAAAFASRPALESRRFLAVVGPPVAVAVTALGLSALRDASLRQTIVERAPVFGPAADLLERQRPP